jgi:hypothetical protein
LARSQEDRAPGWRGAKFRLSYRDVEERQPGCVTSRSCARRNLYRYTGLLVSFIAHNPVSFACTSPSRPPQNTFQFPPVFALHLWGKWYLRSAEANWIVGWHRHSPTTLPLSIGLGRTLVRSGLPPMSFFITGQWMLYRQYASKLRPAARSTRWRRSSPSISSASESMFTIWNRAERRGLRVRDGEAPCIGLVICSN